MTNSLCDVQTQKRIKRHKKLWQHVGSYARVMCIFCSSLCYVNLFSCTSECKELVALSTCGIRSDYLAENSSHAVNIFYNILRFPSTFRDLFSQLLWLSHHLRTRPMRFKISGNRIKRLCIWFQLGAEKRQRMIEKLMRSCDWSSMCLLLPEMKKEIDKISDQSIQSIKFVELCARISMHFYRFRRFFGGEECVQKTLTNKRPYTLILMPAAKFRLIFPLEVAFQFRLFEWKRSIKNVNFFWISALTQLIWLGMSRKVYLERWC